MLNQIQRLLDTTGWESEDQARTANLLNVILLGQITTAIIVVSTLVVLAADGTPFNLIILAFIIAISSGLMLLTRRGRVRTTSVLLSLFLLLITTVTIFIFGGIRNNVASMYFVVVAVAALLLGERAAVVFGLLSILAALGVFYAESNDAIVLAMPVSNNFSDWLILSAALSIETLLLRFAVRNISLESKHIRRDARTLSENNRELRQRATELAILNDIGEKITAVLQLDSVLERAAYLIQDSFDYHHVAFFILDRERDEWVLKARAGDSIQILPLNHRLKLNQGLVGWVGLYGETLLVNDVKTEPRYVRLYPDTVTIQSELSVPIRVGDKVAGVLDVQSPQPHAFDESDVIVVETLAYQSAVAIQNAWLYEALQQELAERERTQEELTRQTQELVRSNAELESFARVVSHDLQEPLRKVQIFSDRLKAKYAGMVDEQARDYLERVQNTAGRMQDLIEALLTYARVTTQVQPFTPVDLNQVAREALSDLQARIEQASGQVEIGDLPTIDADPIQMRQVLQNLIGNALKFHRPGAPPIVKVCAESLKDQAEQAMTQDHDLEFCHIIVQDNGIGFDEKYLDRIFQVFQRLHDRDEYEGTGVGLATCRKIVERHGGAITAKSSEGQGATFIVTLPVKQPEGASYG
jgi:signal transduction histidine kinase